MARSLSEIVARFGGELKGDAGRVISGLATLETATPDQLSFLANPKYRNQLAGTRAGAVILAVDSAAACPCDAIVTSQPYLYFARVSQWLSDNVPAPGIHPAAVVHSPLPASVSIGANCTIGVDVEIGEDSVLYPGVTVYPGGRIGRRAIIHAGAVIGADGFGFAREATGEWVKIAQTGHVVIGDDVEIGANTTIDRGALEDTVIENGVKLDNQIQVGHNVRIGAHTAIAGCVGIAGSATIGARCTIGGAAVILGHLALADGVNVSAGTLVGKSIAQPGNYTGTVPFLPHDEWLKNFARLRHLDALTDKIRALEKRIAELEKNS